MRAISLIVLESGFPAWLRPHGQIQPSAELRASSSEGKCLFQPRTLCAHSIESATAEIQYEPGEGKI